MSSGCSIRRSFLSSTGSAPRSGPCRRCFSWRLPPRGIAVGSGFGFANAGETTIDNAGGAIVAEEFDGEGAVRRGTAIVTADQTLNLRAASPVVVNLTGGSTGSSGYGVGLILLPFVFMPMLGFGDARYVGPAALTGGGTGDGQPYGGQPGYPPQQGYQQPGQPGQWGQQPPQQGGQQGGWPQQ